MNATFHSQLSVKRRGGTIDDWYPLHDLFDSSKELESSNAHRIMLHSMWGLKQVIVPIFGHTLKLTGGGTANVKDAGEQDHLLADFHDRFIPALADYVALLADDPKDAELFKAFDHDNRAFYKAYPQVREHMLSPLANTGALKSLLITHNSWWLNFILPKVFPGVKIQIKDFNLAPSVLFGRMAYADWVTNGRGNPPSFAKINEHRKAKIAAAERAPRTGDVVFDGKRGSMRDVIFD